MRLSLCLRFDRATVPHSPRAAAHAPRHRERTRRHGHGHTEREGRLAKVDHGAGLDVVVGVGTAPRAQHRLLDRLWRPRALMHARRVAVAGVRTSRPGRGVQRRGGAVCRREPDRGRSGPSTSDSPEMRSGSSRALLVVVLKLTRRDGLAVSASIRCDHSPTRRSMRLLADIIRRRAGAAGARSGRARSAWKADGMAGERKVDAGSGTRVRAERPGSHSHLADPSLHAPLADVALSSWLRCRHT